MVDLRDLFSPAFYADPYPFYHRLQATDPVYYHERVGWLVTRYADIKALARDRSTSGREEGGGRKVGQSG